MYDVDGFQIPFDPIEFGKAVKGKPPVGKYTEVSGKGLQDCPVGILAGISRQECGDDYLGEVDPYPSV